MIFLDFRYRRKWEQVDFNEIKSNQKLMTFVFEIVSVTILCTKKH